MLALACWLIGSLALGAAQPCSSHITVTSTADDGPGSLRQAIRDICPDGRINFGPELYGETIALTSGELLLEKDVQIDGPGAHQLAISGNEAHRVFHIANGVRARIEDLSIRDGWGADASLGNGVEKGAGIYNRGTLTLEDCIVKENQIFAAGIGGGGLYNDGPGNEVYIIRCQFLDNEVENNSGSSGRGGAIYNYQGKAYIWDSELNGNASNALLGSAGGIFNEEGYVLLERSTVAHSAGASNGGIYNLRGRMEIRASSIHHNVARGVFPNGGGNGGGIRNYEGRIDIQGSAIYENGASGVGRGGGSGGGISNDGEMHIHNSTISKNTAGSGINGHGGGMYNGGILSLAFCTLTENLVSSFYSEGGGIAQSGTGLSIYGTLIAGNAVNTQSTDPSPDVDGTFTSLGYNLIGNNNGLTMTPEQGDLIGTQDSPIDPLLASLADNGGPTPTHALLEGSPAINAADPNSAISEDQRGFDRPQAGRADIGAFESAFGPATPPPSGLQVTRMVLVDADTDQDLMVLEDGQTIYLSNLAQHVNLRADTDPETVGSMAFYLDDRRVRLENVAPYAIGGDGGGDYFPWEVPLGTHTLRALPYAEANGLGEAGTGLSLTLTFVEDAARQAPLGAGLQGVQLYPNPTEGPLYIQGSVKEPVQLRMLSLTGHQVMRQQLNLRGTTSVDLRSLPPGVYLLELRTQDERLVKRIVHP